jgi:competence protein ComEA
MAVVSLTRRQALVLGLALLAVLAFAGTRLARSGATATARSSTRLSRLTSAPAPRARVVVDVVGAVRRPGLYRLHQGDRVSDAVARAGGATGTADLAEVNLAAPLVDGTQVVVPAQSNASGSLATTSASAASSSGPAAKVSLSSATVEQLDALPGIGPVTAQKIVGWRAAHGAFRSVDALDDVPGIGPAKVEQLRDLVTP